MVVLQYIMSGSGMYEYLCSCEAFREHVRDLAIFMNDQIPMWLKLKPGKQVYAEFETRKGNHERNLGRLSGGWGSDQGCPAQRG